MLPFATDQFRASASRLGGVLGDFTLVPDGLGVCIAGIAAVVGSLAVIFATDYMRGHEEATEPFLCPDLILYRRHGRAGTFRQPAVHFLLLGDHRLLLLCADLVP